MRLLALALHRLAWFIPTLLGLLVVTFFISRVIPADPVALVAGETATPAQVEELRRQLGYDRPLPVQFAQYVARLARGDMGTSIFTRRPIVEDLTHRLPATVEYWPTADPTVIEGNREQRLDAYRAVRDQLIQRIKTRFAMPMASV